MNTCNEVSLTRTVANLSKRTRQSSLLFNGAQRGTTLAALAAFLEPKLPPFKGE